MDISNLEVEEGWSPEYDVREFEASRFVGELIGEDRDRVLNAGCSWGRDFFYLRSRGKSVVNLDIAPQRHLPDVVRADLEYGLPFGSGVFDAVVLTDVLEHLVNDFFVLREARRVLRGDGVVVVSVPFLSDEAEYHVRVHTENSIKRLLGAAGFEVVQYVERGGLITHAQFVNEVIHPESELGGEIGEEVLREVYNTLISADWYLGTDSGEDLSGSKYWGCYVAGEKGEVRDFGKLNAEVFGTQ